MSLVRLAVRLCTVRALMGATLAEARVYDSAVQPVDILAERQRLPLIVVTTDDDQQEPGTKDLLAGPRTLDLVIETVVASAVRTEAGDVDLDIPATDEGLEITLDILERQILRALLTRADHVWAELWRCFVVRVRSTSGRRGADAKDGLRYAARQLLMTVEPLAEPSFAAPENGSVWARFLEAAQDDEAFAVVVAPLVTAELSAPGLSGWLRDAADLGLSAAGVRGIGQAPAEDTATAQPAAVAVITAGGHVVNEAEAAAQWPPAPDA